MKRIKLTLDGMGCGGCVKNVSSALSRLPGLVVHDVAVGSAEVSYEPADISEDALIKSLSVAGYPARLSDAVEATSADQKGGHCGVTR